MKLAWPVNREIATGIGFGYTTASRSLMAALERAGHEIVERDAPIALHFAHPTGFEPIGGLTRDVLFTMYELSPAPSEFAQAFRGCDAAIVPTESTRELLQPRAHGSLPFEVVPLGYDPSVFTWVEREPWGEDTSRPFKWLFVGAQSTRKGLRSLYFAWHQLAQTDVADHFELLIKTTPLDPDEAEERNFDVHNVTFDERRVPRAELAELYHQADGFIFPTLGEGFGLPPVEALATGLPVVTTKSRGVVDVLEGDKEGCILVDTIPYQVGTPRLPGREGGDREGQLANPRLLTPAMIDVMANHRAYLARAARGARRVAAELTWEQAAAKLVKTLDGLVRRGWKMAA